MTEDSVLYAFAELFYVVAGTERPTDHTYIFTYFVDASGQIYHNRDKFDSDMLEAVGEDKVKDLLKSQLIEYLDDRKVCHDLE